MEINKKLDSRDSDPFDSEWVKTDENVTDAFFKLPYKNLKSIDKKIDAFRKKVYSIIIKSSGSPDLAAYVSDDFELIFRGLIVEFSDDFFFSIINAYLSGEIPSNSIANEIEKIII